MIGLGYANAPSGDFVYDDQWQIVRNPLIQSPQYYKKALTSDVWSFRRGADKVVSNYYRPVFTAWSILNYRAFGLDPKGWHIANLLLHALATLLALGLALKLRLPLAGAAVVAWIFAAHPAHVESVTWIAGSPDLLMAVFVLGSALAWWRSREVRSIGWLCGSLLLYLLALGSKELAIAFVPVLFGLAWLVPPEGTQGSALGGLRSALPFAVVAVAFFVARAAVMKGAGMGVQNPVGWTAMGLSFPAVAAFYLRQTFLPFEYSTAYPLRTVMPGSLAGPNFFVPVLVLAGATAGAILLARRNRLARWGILVFALFLAPAFYIRAFAPEHIVRDRYLYLPLFGVLVAIVAAFANPARRRPGVAYGGGLVAAAGLAALTYAYNPVWQSDVAYWTRGVETDPKGALARVQLAESLRVSGDAAGGIDQAQRALQIDPGLERAHLVLGLAYKDRQDRGAAIREFEHAIAAGFETLTASENLAAIHQANGDVEAAIRVLDEEAARNAESRAVCIRNLAVLLVNQGKKEEALKRLESIRPDLDRSVSPRAVAAWFFMGELYVQSGRNEEAREAYRRFLRDSEGMAAPELARMRKTSEEVLRVLERAGRA